jgi:hypothetical protein
LFLRQRGAVVARPTAARMHTRWVFAPLFIGPNATSAFIQQRSD